MSIDTKVSGNPASISGTASWIRGKFSATVDSAASQIYDARNKADSGWSGGASDAFRTKMTSGAQKIDDLHAGAQAAAQHIDDYSAGLARVQNDMNNVRTAASGAGLQVNGELIMEPGAAPADPGPPPTGAQATPEAVSAHSQATQAQADYAKLTAAYQKATEGANSARRAQKFLNDTLQNVLGDLNSKWFLAVGDLANGSVEALRNAHASALAKESSRLADDAAKYMAQATSASNADPKVVYRDVDTARTMANSADDLAKNASDAEAGASKFALKAGGALAAAGVVYDITVGHKPVGQAIVSGAGGFAASVGAGMATGALVGSFVPVPGVGTAVGAVVGAAVGVFTSGAIDSIYQNGIGAVGDAVKAGGDAIVNTGKAIGNVAEDVGGAIGDAWDAIF